MTRWVASKSKFSNIQELPTPHVDAFLHELHDLCKKHKLTISHEDVQGGFIISRYDDESDFEALDDASVDSTVKEL